jgi:hypothetical protein
MRLARTANRFVPVSCWRESVTPAEIASLAISSLPVPVNRMNGRSPWVLPADLEELDAGRPRHVVVRDDAVDGGRLQQAHRLVDAGGRPHLDGRRLPLQGRLGQPEEVRLVVDVEHLDGRRDTHGRETNPLLIAAHVNVGWDGRRRSGPSTEREAPAIYSGGFRSRRPQSIPLRAPTHGL